jgi:hypothetical protein
VVDLGAGLVGLQPDRLGTAKLPPAGEAVTVGGVVSVCGWAVTGGKVSPTPETATTSTW